MRGGGGGRHPKHPKHPKKKNRHRHRHCNLLWPPAPPLCRQLARGRLYDDGHHVFSYLYAPPVSVCPPPSSHPPPPACRSSASSWQSTCPGPTRSCASWASPASSPASARGCAAPKGGPVEDLRGPCWEALGEAMRGAQRGGPEARVQGPVRCRANISGAAELSRGIVQRETEISRHNP